MTKKLLIFLILSILGFNYRYEIKNIIKVATNDTYIFPNYNSKGEFDLFSYVRTMDLKSSSHDLSLTPSLAEDFIKISTEDFEVKCSRAIYKRNDYLVYKCGIEKDFSGTGKYKGNEIYAMFRMAKEINIDTEYEEITIKLNISDDLLCLEEFNGSLAGRWDSKECWDKKDRIFAEFIK